jgi:8-oxo-dGTP pyrophosphatase MutT (NUDIX family)
MERQLKQPMEREPAMTGHKIARILNTRIPRNLGGGGFKPASVLVPIQERPDGHHLVLTLRAAGLNSHGGQVAFPGGRVDPVDLTPLETALRESREEIGLEPRHVQILGQLDQTTAAGHYLITPFVGLIPFPYDFRLNEAETAEVFTVPIAALMDPRRTRLEERPPFSLRGDPIYHFHYERWDIWGATARITRQLLDLAYESSGESR